MNNDKYHCPKCKLLFDSNNHLPRILPTCSHSLCSYCITEQLHQTPQTVTCPLDKDVYKEIVSINYFKENTNLIEELQESYNIPSNHNYEISNEEIDFDNDKSIIMNSDKFNDTMNSMNLNASIMSSSHYQKSKNMRNSLKEKNNSMCEKHTLPLNVICIDEKKKICSQCALNDEHVNHQIITEDEFMNNIENLIDLFQEVDNNQIKYLNFNSINTKLTLDKIGNNIDNYIKMINKTKEDMIKNINIQCEKIENYLNERKKEIFGKYQSTNFDISTLRESTLNWMQNVTIKLDQLNEIKAGEDDGCLKLLDIEPNKNIFNLIRNGKQLNGRYNFVQETIKIIDKLESFDKKGIIKPNKNILDRIFFEQENKKKENEQEVDKDKNDENEDNIEINLNIDELGKKNNIKNESAKKEKEEEDKNIKSTLFQIEENKELINSLHLTKFKFEFIDNKIENNNEDKNQSKEKEKINENNNSNNNNANLNNEDNGENDKKEENNKHENDENEIILNLNINEIKDSNKENDNNNENNKKNDKNNSGGKTNKNNISKIIEEISFNDDTLLINLPTSNPNDTIYHKKVKKDYPKDLKNLKKRDKEKENSIIDKSNTQTTNEPQTNTLSSQAPPVKSITTKKIDISELKSPKTQDIKTNSLNNFINSNNNIINFSDNRSVDNDRDNYNTNNNKNEILINFNRRISGHKKTLQVGTNTIKSDKKIFMKQNSGEKSPNPIMMSRSPGRMISKSKLAGFYNFVPYDKNNKKKLEANQNNNLEKTLINKYDFTNRNKYNKNTFNFNDDNDTNTEYSSNLNERRTSFCINKAIKKTKTINKDNNNLNRK